MDVGWFLSPFFCTAIHQSWMVCIWHTINMSDSRAWPIFLMRNSQQHRHSMIQLKKEFEHLSQRKVSCQCLDLPNAHTVYPAGALLEQIAIWLPGNTCYVHAFRCRNGCKYVNDSGHFMSFTQWWCQVSKLLQQKGSRIALTFCVWSPLPLSKEKNTTHRLTSQI